MKLVIDISEEIFRNVRNIQLSSMFSDDLHKAVYNGTPLPKGHWIEYTRVVVPEPYNKWEQAWHCSECGFGNQEYDETAWVDWKYCPNCGAKMEVE